ncbi:MAG: hypothetical protein ABW346_08460 [Terrimicrobium sp.]
MPEKRPALMPETRPALMPETRPALMPGPANRDAVAKLRELTCGLDENCGLDTIIT